MRRQAQPGPFTSLTRQTISVCQVPRTLSNWLERQAKSSAKFQVKLLSSQKSAGEESMMRELPIFCHLECFQTQDHMQGTKVQEACVEANKAPFPVSKYCYKYVRILRGNYIFLICHISRSRQFIEKSDLESWQFFFLPSPFRLFVLEKIILNHFP